MLAFDHIVIAAERPEKAAWAFGQEQNIKVTEGGKHDSWGTYNYLAYFHNNCYIEWLGIFDEAAAANSDNPLVKLLHERLRKNQDGPVQYALRTDDMKQAVENLQTNHVPYTGPIPGRRQRPDGSFLTWQMLFPETESDILPFLIEWQDGINMPRDTALINQKSIRSLAVPITDVNLFSTIYQLAFEDQAASLENAYLQHSNQIRYLIT